MMRKRISCSYKPKLIYLFLFSILIFLFMQTKTWAGEKQIQAELEKDYSACTFTLTTENAGTHSAKLLSPKGDEYEFSVIDDTTLSCSVSKVSKGVWTAVITDPDREDVGKVQFSVSGKKTVETEIVDDITVAQDIAGLKTYFKNDYFVVSWTDETCGAVNVKITNLDNNEILYNDKSSDKKIECQIPSNVKNISATIVPSKSSNVNGASITYTYSTDITPNATVVYPEYKYTNAEVLPVTVQLYEDYGIYVTNNDSVLISEDNLKAGTYNYELNLKEEGSNAICFYIVDSSGNMYSFDNTVIKDVVPPSISLSEEYDGVKTRDDTFTIEGTVTNYDTFTINGENVKTTTDGHFSYTCTLHLGNNHIELSASDLAGNEVPYDIVIVQLEKKKLPVWFFPALIVFIVITCLLIIIFKLLRKNRNTPVRSQKPHTEVFENNVDNSVKLDKNALNPDISSYEVVQGSKRKTIKSNTLAKNLFSWILVVVVVTIIFNFVLLLGGVKSESMEPTLMTRDIVVYNRLAYVRNEPLRGDIITFKHEGALYSKRIIGIAGDTITFQDGFVYVNGERYYEEYLSDPDIETNCTKTFVVPEGTVFVLGDNRESSYDSRHWENPYVNIKDIKAKFLFLIPTHYI